MKMGKSTAEFTYCAEDKDAEEESGRLKLQTAKEVGGFPLSVGLQADDPFQPQEEIRSTIPCV